MKIKESTVKMRYVKVPLDVKRIDIKIIKKYRHIIKVYLCCHIIYQSIAFISISKQ